MAASTSFSVLTRVVCCCLSMISTALQSLSAKSVLPRNAASCCLMVLRSNLSRSWLDSSNTPNGATAGQWLYCRTLTGKRGSVLSFFQRQASTSCSGVSLTQSAGSSRRSYTSEPWFLGCRQTSIATVVFSNSLEYLPLV